ncbi:hypothetical protein ABZV68_18950 [Streptomyces clavifer]|uniref:hypothetical protein n=1 Tax=Streptomyces clavifer TaxID=68188 RepID=UPI0033BC7EC6
MYDGRQHAYEGEAAAGPYGAARRVRSDLRQVHTRHLRELPVSTAQSSAAGITAVMAMPESAKPPTYTIVVENRYFDTILMLRHILMPRRPTVTPRRDLCHSCSG